MELAHGDWGLELEEEQATVRDTIHQDLQTDLYGLHSAVDGSAVDIAGSGDVDGGGSNALVVARLGLGQRLEMAVVHSMAVFTIPVSTSLHISNA